MGSVADGDIHELKKLLKETNVTKRENVQKVVHTYLSNLSNERKEAILFLIILHYLIPNK